MVREKLRLVGRHVHVDRTVIATAFAGQAQIESVAHLGGLPAVGDDVTFEHLEQQTGTAARGVFLLTGGAIARAHDPGFVAAALADTDAAVGGDAEPVVVVGVGEMGGGLGGPVVRTPPQVLVQPVREHHFSRVHPIGRVEDAFELFERRDHALTEHDRQQLAAGLPVTVLT